MGRLNLPAKEGYTYRSPKQTNARDLTPNLKEDAVASQRADVERVRKGLEAPAKTAYNRRMQQEAAGRALIRSAGRAGMAGTALQGGYEAGRAIDEATGVGRKMVEKAGPMIDRATSGERVKLTKEAQDRVDEDRDFEVMQKALRDVDEEDGKAKGGKVGYAKGGSIDGCAQRGKTRGTMR